jgi:hypothetical protein
MKAEFAPYFVDGEVYEYCDDEDQEWQDNHMGIIVVLGECSPAEDRYFVLDMRGMVVHWGLSTRKRKKIA